MAKPTVENIQPALQLNEEIGLHEWGWKVQRAGWVFIFLLPVLGALGLFGEGVLSHQQKQAGAITTSFDRFYRYEKQLKIAIQSSGENISQVAIARNYLQHMRVEHVLPEPVSQKAINNDIVFYFEGSQNQLVTFYVRPEKSGNLAGQLTVNRQPFSINHFIYP